MQIPGFYSGFSAFLLQVVEVKMFRSLWYRVGGNLSRTAATINGQPSSSSSSSSSRYTLFTLQNPDVLIRTTRFTSMFFSSKLSSFFINNSNVNSSSSDSSFVTSYLINSCGLSKTEAVSVSEKVYFKTKSQPDSVIELLENHGFTKPYISKLIPKRPSLLLSDPDKTLKPKLDFFNSRGLQGIDLAEISLKVPDILALDLDTKIIPLFNILRSIVGSDTEVIRILKRSMSWVFRIKFDQTLSVNIEVLKQQGVCESIIRKNLIDKPVLFMVSADKFKKSVEKVKEMGFDPLATTYFVALKGLTSMNEDCWRKKLDVYKRWGLSEDQMKSAFRKNPFCMMHSVDKITEVMDFVVNEMGYDSSVIAETPMILNYNLKEKIVPKCSVIRILVSKGLIKENVPLKSLPRMSEKSFLDKFVKPYEQEVPELMMVFKSQPSYQELLLK